MTRTPRYAGHILTLRDPRGDEHELITWAWHPDGGPETADESQQRIHRAGVANQLTVECTPTMDWLEPAGFSPAGGPSDPGEPDTPGSWLAMLDREIGTARRLRGLSPGGPEKLGYEPLAPGEASIRVRIRGPAAVLEPFEALDARERGKVVTRGLANRREAR